MTDLEDALRRICRALDALAVRYALVGGLAVSIRAEPRLTRDADLAVAVRSDAEAEAVVGRLRSRGFAVDAIVEQETGEYAVYINEIANHLAASTHHAHAGNH